MSAGPREWTSTTGLWESFLTKGGAVKALGHNSVLIVVHINLMSTKVIQIRRCLSVAVYLRNSFNKI